MHLHTRNVGTAFRELVTLFHNGGRCTRVVPSTGSEVREVIPVERRESRNGPVLRIGEPVTVSYSHPRERVLLNAARDCNPFTNLYEALWHLAGREDVASLAYYTPRFRDYSDDGVTLNDAYGYRWRHAETFDRPDVDQLDLIVAHLLNKPDSRRAVLQMWGVDRDLCFVGDFGDDLAFTADDAPSKSVCCNTSVMFSLRQTGYCMGGIADGTGEGPIRALDMTVTNRSNDLIWGALGANPVTFSVLQEYMAARLGVGVGVYHHFSNDLHVYTESNSGFHPEKWLADTTPDPYTAGTNRFVPLVRDPAAFEAELPSVVEQFSGPCLDKERYLWSEPFFTGVAGPMFRAFSWYKSGKPADARRAAESIAADDWRIACVNWLDRRAARKGVK